MPGPTTEVLNDDLIGMRSDLQWVETTLAMAVGKLAAKFELFEWPVGLTLVIALSEVVSLAYWAGS